MIRLLSIVALCLFGQAHISQAQDAFPGFKSNAEIKAEKATRAQAGETEQVASDGPIARIEMPMLEGVPGQALDLRITVLVPSYMPQPPVIPVLDQPNLMVADGGSGPVTETVNGASWSGVSKRYKLTPLVAGTFEIAQLEVGVTWADPETNAPIKTTLALAAQRFSAAVPEGAENLDPFVAADAVTLTQTVEGASDGMKPGDSLIRTIVAEISGSTAIMLPPITPTGTFPGMAAYPDSASVTDSEDRGHSTGTRTERTVYVAEGGGQGTLPAVELRWYNIGTGQIETALVDPVDYVISGPVLRQVLQWRKLAVALGLAMLALVVLNVIRRNRRRRTVGLDGPSEVTLYRDLKKAVHARDLHNIYKALDSWAMVKPGIDPRQQPDVVSALTRIGAGAYGTSQADSAASWAALGKALSRARHTGTETQTARKLPALNPTRPA